MNTFTMDTWYGKMNPDTNEMEAKMRSQLSSTIEEYIRYCINNDMEVSSAEGFFYGLVFQQMAEARLKVVDDFKKKNLKIRDRVFFIDYYEGEIVEASITSKMGTSVTVIGKSGSHKGKQVTKHITELFVTAALAQSEYEKHM